MSSLKIFTGILMLFLLSGCVGQHYDEILINEEFVTKKISELSRPMASLLHQSDLNMQFTRTDYLHAGWDIADPLTFFELLRLKGHEENVVLLLYARVVSESQKIWDVRVATVEGYKVRYNFPVWQNSFQDRNYTRISKRKGEYVAEIIRGGRQEAVYFMEKGEVETE